MSGGDDAREAAEELAAHRGMLFGLAYRLLGSVDDAEDVLQEAYLRWLRADRARIEHPRRYLSRVVTRLALDRLPARQAEVYVGEWLPEPLATGPGPAELAADRDSLSLAALHLMERLTPAERAVYVLRTAFDLAYREIASILDLGDDHCRQLYRRAAQRMHEGRPRFPADREAAERMLTGFVAAAAAGDIASLGRLLRDDVVAWSDGGGRVRAALNPIRGRDKVMRFFRGIYGCRTVVTEPVDVNNGPGLIIRYGPRVHLLTTATDDGAITGLYLVSNPDKIHRLLPSPNRD